MSKVTVLSNKEDMSKAGVYKISNTQNKMMYIGSTVKFSSRLSGHLCDCKRGKGNRFLTTFIEDFGEEELLFQIIEIVEDKTALKTRENYWISKYDFDDLWNCAPKADTIKGVKMPESHRKASRERMLGNSIMKGKKVKKETLAKISDFWKNNPERLEQMKIKNKESQEKIDKSKWDKGNIIEVYYNGELIDTLYGLKKVRDKYNLAYVMTSKLVTGKKDVYKGYSLKKIGSYHKTESEYIERYNSGKIIKTRL